MAQLLGFTCVVQPGRALALNEDLRAVLREERDWLTRAQPAVSEVRSFRDGSDANRSTRSAVFRESGYSEAMPQIYESLGVGYSTGRRQDPRIADVILRAVGDSASIVNVGAGSGSYEPGHTRVVSVEPSLTMIRQRRTPSPLLVQARAECLPFHDDVFDCALAVLTIHHWSPVGEGLRELRRVARKTVILSWDQEIWERFWLFDYCPDLREQDRQRAVAISTIADVLGFCHVIPVLIPNDCLDGFQGAFWKRPAAYLDSEVRGRMSGFAQAPRHSYEDGLARLAADLSDGTWQREHAALMERDAMDVGYRLVIADRSSQ